MSLTTPTTPPDLAAAIGLTEPNGEVTLAHAADHLRLAAARWGPTSRAKLSGHLRTTLRACGLDPKAHTPLIAAAFVQLFELGELVEVDLTEEDEEGEDTTTDTEDIDDPLRPAPRPTRRVILAAPTLRLVDLGGGHLLLGAHPSARLPIKRFGPPACPAHAARWVTTQAEREHLRLATAYELQPSDWLGPPEALTPLQRRAPDLTAHRCAELLPALWRAVVGGLECHGRPIDEPHRLSVLTAQPGAYFGQPTGPSGRWRPLRAAPDGSWPAVYLPKNGPRRPMLVEVQNGKALKVLDLYDEDELRWVILARAASVGEPELARLRLAPEGPTLELTCWVPDQLRRLRSIAVVEGWRWLFPPWVDSSQLKPAVEELGLKVELHT